jgi:hypothetical protein
MFERTEAIEAFIQEFESCRLPKAQWTHQAHLVVGLWYVTHYLPDDVLALVRQRIRTYNEAVGTANTDNGGYHETLTRFFLRGIAAHVAQHRDAPLPTSLAALLQSPLARADWPLTFYSRSLLFSVTARRQWVEPDQN